MGSDIMTQSFMARKMVPGKDTIKVMALHYGLKPSVVRDVIRKAGVKVIREDGYRSKLVFADTRNAVVSSRTLRPSKVVGWEDGELGVDPETTRLTKAAIMAVAHWSFAQKLENDSDN
jgi:hypothetical protein